MSVYPNNPLIQGNTPYYQNNIPFNPVIPNYPTIQHQAPQMQINCVNGRESAQAFSIGPNSSVVLVDNLEPKIWIVTTDSSGYKAVNGFRIIPDNEPQQPIPAEGKVETPDPIKDLTERIEKLEERMNNNGNANGQSNNRSSYQNKSGNDNYRPNNRNGSGSQGSNGAAAANGNEQSRD